MLHNFLIPCFGRVFSLFLVYVVVCLDIVFPVGITSLTNGLAEIRLPMVSAVCWFPEIHYCIV